MDISRSSLLLSGGQWFPTVRVAFGLVEPLSPACLTRTPSPQLLTLSPLLPPRVPPTAVPSTLLCLALCSKTFSRTPCLWEGFLSEAPIEATHDLPTLMSRCALWGRGSWAPSVYTCASMFYSGYVPWLPSRKLVPRGTPHPTPLHPTPIRFLPCSQSVPLKWHLASLMRPLVIWPSRLLSHHSPSLPPHDLQAPIF